MCDVLKELYQEVFNESFTFDLSNRIKMQKMVYILENLGVHIGEYGFVWAEYGPYSIALDDDAYRCSVSPGMKDFKFSNWAEQGLDMVRKILLDCKEDDKKNWLERIASLHFLKYVDRYTEVGSAIGELVRRKPHMNDENVNKCALHWADKIETYLWGDVA